MLYLDMVGSRSEFVSKSPFCSQRRNSGLELPVLPHRVASPDEVWQSLFRPAADLRAGLSVQLSVQLQNSMVTWLRLAIGSCPSKSAVQPELSRAGGLTHRKPNHASCELIDAESYFDVNRTGFHEFAYHQYSICAIYTDVVFMLPEIVEVNRRSLQKAICLLPPASPNPPSRVHPHSPLLGYQISIRKGGKRDSMLQAIRCPDSLSGEPFFSLCGWGGWERWGSRRR
jgi:hypothetical protein